VGIVNYLIKQKTIEEITNHTHIPFLDVILSGPIPPILRDDPERRYGRIDRRAEEKYDYIILDTPPVGLCLTLWFNIVM
jgi:MinD-like ATPase involved in chromosome partitioning or flagellar assembly